MSSRRATPRLGGSNRPPSSRRPATALSSRSAGGPNQSNIGERQPASSRPMTATHLLRTADGAMRMSAKQHARPASAGPSSLSPAASSRRVVSTRSRHDEPSRRSSARNDENVRPPLVPTQAFAPHVPETPPKDAARAAQLKKTTPVPTSPVAATKAASRRRRARREEGLVDVDGDGLVDSHEYYLAKSGYFDDVVGEDTNHDGRIDAQELLASKTKKGREHVLTEWAKRNRGKMYAYGPEFGDTFLLPQDQKPSAEEVVERLRQRSKDVYRGNFAVMMRDLENKEQNVNIGGSAHMRGILRPTSRVECPKTALVTFPRRHKPGRQPDGFPPGGYNTSRRNHEETMTRLFKTPAPFESMMFRRRKGGGAPLCLPGVMGRTNCCGWAEASMSTCKPVFMRGAPCGVPSAF